MSHSLLLTWSADGQIISKVSWIKYGRERDKELHIVICGLYSGGTDVLWCSSLLLVCLLLLFSLAEEGPFLSTD